MLVVGLTGGIGCGKSVAADFFARQGVPVIDADVIARDLVVPGSPILQKVVEHFGDSVLSENGQLNRQALREVIFNDSDERQWLEGLMHPVIRQQVDARVGALVSGYCVVVIPLLKDRLSYPMLDRVLVVDVDDAVQVQRACARDGISVDDVRKIIASQLPRGQRLSLADDVVTNNESLEDFRLELDKFHHFYLELS